MTTTVARPTPSRDPAYGRYRRRQQAYGRWQPYVDAEPARTHARALMAYGIGWMRLARLAGIPQSTLEKLLYGSPQRGQGPSRRIRPETAEKILAVHASPTLLADAAEVDSAGTHRRIQALVAAGWPQRQIAIRLGMDPANISKTMRSPRVMASTARAAQALYDQLWNVDPLEHGITLHSYNRSRRHAHTNRWAPAGAWDDDHIDDPTAFPDWTGHCGTPKGYRAHYAHDIPMCDPCRDAHSTARRNAA